MDPATITAVVAAAKASASLVSAFKKMRTGHKGYEIVVDTSAQEQALSRHLTFVSSWASTTTVHGLTKALNRMYVSLELYEGESRRSSTEERRLPVLSLLEEGESSIILGGPGAGKSTSLQRLANHLLTCEPTEREQDLRFPIVLRVRDLDKTESITEGILSAVGIRIWLDVPDDLRNKDTFRSEEQRIRESALSKYLSEAKPLVLIDGLDESDAHAAVRIARESDRLINQTDTMFIMTCRHGAYTTKIDSLKPYSIERFTKTQLESFAKRWWIDDSDKSEAFLSCLEEKPYRGLATTPLHATNFCMLFDANGDLPEENTRVYERIVDIRVRVWDLDRGISRRSSTPGFDPDQKRRFLSNLAFEFVKLDHAPTFSVNRFLATFDRLKSRFRLEKAAPREILSEIESHTGLIYLSGFEQYDFMHKSIQEFLLGKYLASIPLLSEYQAFLRNTPDACALGTVLSEDPDSFIACLWKAVPGPSRSREPWASVFLFWNQYFLRLVEEHAVFRGNKILGLAILGVVSDCFSRHRPGTPEFNDHVRTALRRQNQEELKTSKKKPKHGEKEKRMKAAQELEEAGTQILSTVQRALALPGVGEGISAIIERAFELTDETLDGWGTTWVRISSTRKVGISDSIGEFAYPEGLWVPTEWI